jgi:hypothetical protein
MPLSAHFSLQRRSKATFYHSPEVNVVHSDCNALSGQAFAVQVLKAAVMVSNALASIGSRFSGATYTTKLNDGASSFPADGKATRSL